MNYKRDVMERVVGVLLKQETLEQEEFKLLVEGRATEQEPEEKPEKNS